MLAVEFLLQHNVVVQYHNQSGLLSLWSSRVLLESRTKFPIFNLCTSVSVHGSVIRKNTYPSLALLRESTAPFFLRFLVAMLSCSFCPIFCHFVALSAYISVIPELFFFHPCVPLSPSTYVSPFFPVCSIDRPITISWYFQCSIALSRCFQLFFYPSTCPYGHTFHPLNDAPFHRTFATSSSYTPVALSFCLDILPALHLSLPSFI